MALSVSPVETIAWASLLGAAGQWLGNRLRMPPILFWLTAGMLLGPGAAGLIDAGALRDGLPAWIELALVVILFEGGLNLDLRTMRREGGLVGRLLLLGILASLGIGGVAAHVWGGLGWEAAAVFGALAAISGPAVVAPILKHVRVHRRLAQVLLGEAMLVDALGAVLAVVLLQGLAAGAWWPNGAWWLARTLGVGLAFGLVGGAGLGWLLARAAVRDSELRMVFAVAWVWAFAATAGQFAAQAGLVSAIVAGVVVQRFPVPDIARLKRFKGAIVVWLVSTLFVILAASLDLQALRTALGPGLGVFAALAFVARPLAAWLATLGAGWPRADRAFLAAFAPKGIVVAGMASLAGESLAHAEVAGAERFEALVFVVVLAASLVYGLMSGPLKRWLGVRGPEHTMLIVGGGALALEIGRAMEGWEVWYLDSDPYAVARMRRAGARAVSGNPMDPLFLELAGAPDAAAALVMTPGTEHNLLIARILRDDFRVETLWVAVEEGDERTYAKLMQRLGVVRAFGKHLSYTYWADQAYRKRLVYETRTIAPDSPLVGCRLADVRIPNGVLPIVIRRGKEATLAHDDWVLAAGDEVVLLLRPERVEEGQPLLLPPVSEKSGVRAQFANAHHTLQ